MSQGSQSHNLDDVPIALTEKWKLPPLPCITEDMVEKFFLPNLGQSYDYTLEQKVLDKISQWENQRQDILMEKEARNERIRMRQKEKQRRIEEQLTQVSYPDELSDPEDDVEKVQIVERQFELLTPTVVGECLKAAPSTALSWNGGSNNLELADFEKASDPYDTMELKTIDDLDVLAQVLKSSHVHSDDSPAAPTTETTPTTNNDSTTTTATSTPVNSSYHEAAMNYNNYHQQQQQHQNNQFYHIQMPNQCATFITNYAPYNVALQHQHIPSADESTTMTTVVLKSKSVPDIFKELEAEVNDSRQRRIRNNSQSAHQENGRTSNSIKISTSTSNSQDCDELLTKLPKHLQNLVKNINQMGFPLDRIVRVAEALQVGDDKKIIEHLIPLSELLDLGFEEKRISEALIKFGNNKEKALDFLIS